MDSKSQTLTAQGGGGDVVIVMCNVADEPVSAAGVSCSTAARLLTAELSAGWGVWPHVPAKHQHSFSIPAPGTCTARVVNEPLLSFTVAGEYYNKDIILVNNPKILYVKDHN